MVKLALLEARLAPPAREAGFEDLTQVAAVEQALQAALSERVDEPPLEARPAFASRWVRKPPLAEGVEAPVAKAVVVVPKVA